MVLQAEMADCGAACLAMVLAAHGKDIPLETIKARMPTQPEGVNALAILETAQHFGLSGRGVSASLAAMRRLAYPAIVHWHANHYVVVTRWKNGYVEMNDPGMGRLKLTTAKFAEHFSGTVLLFEEKKRSVIKKKRS